MVKKLKLDKEKLKKFLLEKVELVGLGAAGVIAFFLLVIGLMAAFGASSPDRDIKKDNDNLRTALNSTTVPDSAADEGKRLKADATKWGFTRLDTYTTEPWYEVGAAGDPKRRNPPARPIDTFSRDGKERYCQVTPVPGGFFEYTVNTRTAKIDAIVRKEDRLNKAVAPPAQRVHTEHVVLVEALFPYRDQVKDYLKALRVNTVEELQAQGLMPVFDGLNVIRGTVVDLQPVPESAGEFFSPSWKVAVKLAPKGDKLEVHLKNQLKRTQEVNNLQFLVQVEPGGPAVPVPPVTAKQPLAEAGKPGDSLVQVLDVQGFAGKQVVGMQQLDWQPVYTHDKNGKVKISPPNETLLRTAVYDLTRIEEYSHLLPPDGADTPFPKYVRDQYPTLKLDGVALKEVEAPADVVGAETTPPPMPPGLSIPKPQMPMPGGLKGKGPGVPVQPAERPEANTRIEPRPLKDYPKPFVDRVTGKLNPFNVYGVFLEAPEQGKAGYPGAVPGAVSPMGLSYPMGFQPGGYDKDLGGIKRRGLPMPPPAEAGKGEKAATGLEALPEKLLIRFIDAGLEPGQTYQYYVQVRLKNPNFGKDKAKLVAFPAMAEKTHLESPFVLTPPVFMPQDYAFYFVNQYPLATSKTLLRQSPRTTVDKDLTIPPGKIPVQIHQLVQNSTVEDGQEVGDWVVAERLFLGRGDLIARRNLDVEVPVWDRKANAFELGELNRSKKNRNPKKAIPVDFGDDTSPVLVDFRGGKIDEGNIEVLIMNGDGHLMVRHSYEDSDPESPVGTERAHRYETWRTRLEAFRNAAAAPATIVPKGLGPNNPNN
jgi:hypothetical protein